MVDITKKEFAVSNISGSNYLTWKLDIEIHLSAEERSATIKPIVQTTPPQKVKTLIFLRHHLTENLKAEYVTERDPVVLWQSLKDRFDHQ